MQVSLESSVRIGFEWPSAIISGVDIIGVPILIRVVLLSSGVRVTLSHRSAYRGKCGEYYKSYLFTVVMGVIFVMIQCIEYNGMGFRLGNGVVRSVFYVLTFIHGFHVVAGVVANLFVLVRSIIRFIPLRFIGVEVVIWY